MTFTAHNVVLPDGSQTLPGKPLAAQSGTVQAALRYLEEVFGPAPHDGEFTLADVGCLEGGYTAAFARAGYDATGFEARKRNYDNAVELSKALMLPNLRFVLGDARETLPGWAFDAVFCSGLLYHMDYPVKFLNLLGEVTRRVLILNTHVSMGNGGHPEHVHSNADGFISGRCLPGPAQHEGVTGHWYEELEDPLGSYGNTSSFWPRKEDLLASLTAAGFTDVSERDDWRGGERIRGGGGVHPDHVMIVALK